MTLRWIARASAGLCLATGCATLEARAACPRVDAGDAILRSRAALEAQLTSPSDHQVEQAPMAPCSLRQFGDVDWNTQAIAVLHQDGTSTVDRMTVRGDTLQVVRQPLRQCGGQEIVTWQGILLVVVPAQVRTIELGSRRAKPCPNRRGPAPP